MLFSCPFDLSQTNWPIKYLNFWSFIYVAGSFGRIGEKRLQGGGIQPGPWFNQSSSSTGPKDFHRLGCLEQSFQVSSLGPPSENLPSLSALAPALLSAVGVEEHVLVFTGIFICYVTSRHMCKAESGLTVITLHSSANVCHFRPIKWVRFQPFWFVAFKSVCCCFLKHLFKVFCTLIGNHLKCDGWKLLLVSGREKNSPWDPSFSYGRRVGAQSPRVVIQPFWYWPGRDPSHLGSRWSVWEDGKPDAPWFEETQPLFVCWADRWPHRAICWWRRTHAHLDF